MKNKIEKNDLIFYYQEYTFPTHLVAEDVLRHKEAIFNDHSEEPELAKSTKKIKYSQCFVLEDEIEHKGKGGFRKGGQIGKPPHKPYQNQRENVWRKNEPEENTGFFDDFKGKTDVKQVAQFKRNLEVSVSNETSISIQKSMYLDYLNKTVEIKPLNTLKYYEPSENVLIPNSLSADNFFDNADKIMCTISQPDSSTKTTNKSKSKLSQAFNNIDPNPNVVNIDQIFKINEFLHYPKEENLWYIFHPTAKSSFGPISSPNIKEMYESKMLTGQSEIRFIDIYNLRNKKPFSFFVLKEIEYPNFLEEIEISPLLKVAVAMKSKQVEQEGVKVPDKNQNKTTPPKNNTIAPQQSDIPYGSDSIYSVGSTTTKTDQKRKKSGFEGGEAIVEVTNQPSANPSKKSKKLPKGKPVDLDTKLGKYLFYNLLYVFIRL